MGSAENRCPACGSCSLRRDRHAEKERDESVKVHAAHAAGHRSLTGLAVAGVGWLLNRATNAMDKRWECRDCGHTFS